MYIDTKAKYSHSETGEYQVANRRETTLVVELCGLNCRRYIFIRSTPIGFEPMIDPVFVLEAELG